MRNTFRPSRLLYLALATVVWGCGASRSEDEVGAAPDRGDTAAVAPTADTSAVAPAKPAMPADTIGRMPADTFPVQPTMPADTMGGVGMPADTSAAYPDPVPVRRPRPKPSPPPPAAPADTT